MDTADKKADQSETAENFSILTQAQYQLEHREHKDMEPIKDEMTTSNLQDPFSGEEGTQVQYRIMKWWYVSSFPD